jgi:methyl-accepting chemotaxis protein
MKWFHDLRVSLKFISCFITILLVMMVGNISGLINTNMINGNLVHIYENDLSSIKELGAISSSYNRLNTSLGSYLLINNSEYRKKEREIITSKQKEIDDILASFSSLSATDDEKNELELFKTLWSAYPKAIEKVTSLADQNQNEFAKTVYEKEILSKQDGITKTFQGLIEMNQKKADTRYAASLDKYLQVKLSSIIIMVVSLLISGILGYLITYSILKPIRRLLEAFKNMESGDLSQTVETHRRDELGQLEVGFEKMRQSVSSIVSQTKHIVGYLSNVSNDIRGYAITTGGTSQVIFHGLKEAVHTSNQQATRIAEDSIVIKEVSFGLKQVAFNIDEVSSLSNDMERASNSGQLVVRDALEKMSAIQQKSQQTTTIVQELGGHSAEIDGILLTIKNIAEETNLLALNASIEAARAGDAGRGFSIVANEVRKLAENSKQAAIHVGLVIARIQESTRDLFSSSQEWIVEMNEGHTKVNDVSTVFKKMYEWIQSMNDSIQDITASIEEMSAGSEQIDFSMKRIEESSQSVSEVNEKYSEKSGQQVEMMEKVNASAEQLLKISDELHVLVNRFVTT